MKTALITGGTRGIGLGISTKFAELGYHLVLLGRQPRPMVSCILNKLEQYGNNVIYIQGDLSQEDSRKDVLSAAQHLDVLINNAGVAPKKRTDLLHVQEDSYDFVMDTNAKGTFFLTQAAANKMIQQGGGTIINICSMSAYTSSVNRAEYCISKAAVSMMTALFADRLAEYGIPVYEIRPGIIKTHMTDEVADKYDKLIFEEHLLPIRRWGFPEDVAKAAALLAGGELPYSTGEVLNVDGGFHLRRL